jgi:transposase-like protein
MTDARLPLAELLEKAGETDFLRAVAEAVLQLLMESDVEGLIGAGRYERSAERLTYRNGFRERALDTRLGTLQLRVPKLRQGSYFPPFLEPRKVSEKALVAVIQEAWIGGVSTRRVDDLVQAMGLAGISKSTVSKLCKDIGERVTGFLERPLEGEWPDLWLDATYLKVREGGRIVPVAAIIAVAVDTEGRREIVGLHLGPSEAETCWAAFLRMRSALAHVGKGQQAVVAAALRQAFLQADEAAAHQVWRQVADQLRPRWPKLAAFMDESEHDVLAYTGFPAQHRAKLHSTNPLERLNKEVKRRADVVGIFPGEASITRLIGAVLLEQNDEWPLQHRYMQVEAMAELMTPTTEPEPAQIPPQAA